MIRLAQLFPSMRNLTFRPLVLKCTSFRFLHIDFHSTFLSHCVNSSRSTLSLLATTALLSANLTVFIMLPPPCIPHTKSYKASLIINDVSFTCIGKLKLFADDIKLYSSFNVAVFNCGDLQQSLDLHSTWANLSI